MTRQKSEGRVVPHSRGNPATTRAHKGGGGKAAPVKEEDNPQLLLFATAEHPRRGATAGRSTDRSVTRKRVVPKANSKWKAESPASMEEVVERLGQAFWKVARNDGAPGPDRQSVEEVAEHLDHVLRETGKALLAGTFVPGDIRRVWIPKSGGGQRGLGIPNVVDRMVQEAVRATLEPLYEPTFHPSSHGFRPDRSCQTAITEARSYVDEGFLWVVDMDLADFFNTVPQQRLMARLGQRVHDQRVLRLIGKMLRAKVIMPDGVKVSTDEGVPQGGPLSPLLSNVVLSELDEELARRGLRFVRYADDCNIYVRSERAGQRVMASVSAFIHKRLRLRVNGSKSAVARPETRHFLGFRLVPGDGQPAEVLLSERSVKRLHARLKELTPRNCGRRLETVIRKVNQYLTGWMGHFRTCTEGVAKEIRGADAHLRRRLRALVLKQWKTKRTIARRLIRLGVSRNTAWRRVYEGRKSIWALSHISAVERGLRNAYFAERGLSTLTERFADLWADLAAPVQLPLHFGLREVVTTAEDGEARCHAAKPALLKSRM